MHLQISHIAVVLMCLRRCGSHQRKERLRLPTPTIRRTLLACSETCVVRKLCLLVAPMAMKDGGFCTKINSSDSKHKALF